MEIFKSLRVYHEASFDYKFLKIGSVCVRDIIKHVAFLQAFLHAPAPLTPPVFRLILLHSEAIEQRILQQSLHSKN